MKKWIKTDSTIVCTAFMLVAALCLGISALDVEYIGSIDDSLFAPTSLAVTEGRIAVLEPFSKQLKIFTSDGVIRHRVDFGGDANGLAAQSATRFLFCDRRRRQVTALDIDRSESYDFVAGTFEFSDPTDLIISQSKVYVLDAGFSSILILDELGRPIGEIEIRKPSGEPIGYASNFTYNPVKKQFYVFDQENSSILVFDSMGRFISGFGSYGSKNADITRGGDILYSALGYLLVSDRYQSRVLIFTLDGKYVTSIDPAMGYGGDLNIPTGLAIDNNGLLYVSSTEGANIEIFYLGAATAQAQFAEARQVYPPPMDTLDPVDVKLIASAQTTTDMPGISGFDFELYVVNESQSKVVSVSNLSPDHVVDSSSMIITSTAEWQLDAPLKPAAEYQWRTRISYADTVTAWTDMRRFSTTALPYRFHLDQNYPNPFNPATTISFTLPKQSNVTLEVLNLLGQRITTLADEEMPTGRHSITWEGTDSHGRAVATGLYFYKLVAGEHSQTRKMVLLK